MKNDNVMKCEATVSLSLSDYENLKRLADATEDAIEKVKDNARNAAERTVNDAIVSMTDRIEALRAEKTDLTHRILELEGEVADLVEKLKKAEDKAERETTYAKDYYRDYERMKDRCHMLLDRKLFARLFNREV